MVDGKYSIVMQTPMGPVNGTLTLKTDGERLSGILEAMGGRHPFTGGTVRGMNAPLPACSKRRWAKYSFPSKG